MIPYFSRFERAQINMPYDFPGIGIFDGQFNEFTEFTSLRYICPPISSYGYDVKTARRKIIKRLGRQCREKNPPVVILFINNVFKEDIKAYSRGAVQGCRLSRQPIT